MLFSDSFHIHPHIKILQQTKKVLAMTHLHWQKYCGEEDGDKQQRKEWQTNFKERLKCKMGIKAAQVGTNKQSVERAEKI